MTTVQRTDRLAQKARIRTGTVIAAIGALIAVGVTTVLIALTATSTTRPVAHNQSAPYHSLIQYRGTGAPPGAPTTHTAPTYIRAEHSFGAVP
ncbi:MAG: hypothetical protein J2P47_16240 [Acetobacteraceae bacterium]|nr:hypothetical protein [Acetobacteraceae bacterium]